MITRRLRAAALAVAAAVFTACTGDLVSPVPGIDAPGRYSAAILPGGPLSVSDDFSGPAIDGSKWVAVTDGIPQGGAAASQSGGYLFLTNRAHLNTVQTFDPVNGAVHITGEWTMVGAGEDFIQIVTRSSGTPGGDYGETTSGINFFACSGSAECSNAMGIGGNGVVSLNAPGFIALVPGATYLFDVTDDGSNLTFTLTRQDDPVQTRTVTAQSDYVSETNLVTFHNRELCCDGSHTARLDNVTITGSSGQAPSAPQALSLVVDHIAGLGLSNGQRTSLEAPLNAALQQLARGHTAQAKNQLNAFINQVRAKSGKSLTAAQADDLIAAAQSIIASLP